MKTTKTETFSLTENYESICNEEVFTKLFTVLMAYAYSLIGNSNLRLSKNRQELAKDFAMETIKDYLSSPEKFDPARNKDLVNYLKYNILKRLIFNFKQSKGQKNEEIINDNDPLCDKIVSRFYSVNSISDSIDVKIILKSINDELKSDILLKSVFKLRYLEEYKRTEICSKLQITYGELNNYIRRLDTLLKRVLENYKTDY